jgi:hydroxyacylglutathione hydrolase
MDKSHYTSKKIDENITRIADIDGVYMYLVEGSKQAALIDTGYGVGDLKKYVESLTLLPVIVILTHAHPDHGGGSLFFDKVYLNNQDLPLLPKYLSMFVRKFMLINYVIKRRISFKDFTPTKKDGYLPLENGQTFDLGGITLEALALPGHTPGSMCILVKEKRLLLLGDACNSSTLLHFPECCSVEEYRNNLLGFSTQNDSKYDNVLYSHEHNFGRKGIVVEMAVLCDEIMQGKDDRILLLTEPAVIGGHVAKKMSKLPGTPRADGGTANLIYSPKKVYQRQ